MSDPIENAISAEHSRQERAWREATDRDELVSACRAFALQTEPYGVAGILNEAAARIQADAATIARMREALEFYAKPQIYEPHPHGPAFDQRDLSFCAHAALKGGDHGIAAMGEGDVR